MRRMILLLTTMALALLLAAGVALAATVTCQVGVTCKGTSSADTITGTTSNDTINGLAGNDTIKALDGIDKINGGPNNDTMNGGPGNDTYLFATSFGADRISADSGGVDTLSFAPHKAAYNSNGGGISVALVADGSTLCPPDANPCLSIQGNFIENLVGTPFVDSLVGNEFNNKITGGAGGVIENAEYMDGQAGADTYAGYGSGVTASGVDLIEDTGGSTNIDKLSLTKFNLADAGFAYGSATTGGPITFLRVTLPDSSQIFLWNYFNGTSTDFCASGPGTGLIEKIIFADDPNVDFAQVKSFGGCPAAPGSQATGNMQEGQLPQSSVPQPESSNGTNGMTTNLQR
jgi:Ca2+-binding RTX toxin-like protein